MAHRGSREDLESECQHCVNIEASEPFEDDAGESEKPQRDQRRGNSCDDRERSREHVEVGQAIFALDEKRSTSVQFEYHRGRCDDYP